jgi:hypothetical protein
VIQTQEIQDRNMVIALYALSLAQGNTIIATSIQSKTIEYYLVVADELLKQVWLTDPRYDINIKITACIKVVLSK